MSPEVMPQTTLETFTKRIAEHGGHFLIGEYRGSGVSVVEYLDKESGKKESYVKVMHSIEVGSPGGFETVHVQEQIDRSIKKAEEYQTWLRRGMQVVAVPRSLLAEKGIKKFTCGSADLFALVKDGAKVGGGKS